MYLHVYPTGAKPNCFLHCFAFVAGLLLKHVRPDSINYDSDVHERVLPIDRSDTSPVTQMTLLHSPVVTSETDDLRAVLASCESTWGPEGWVFPAPAKYSSASEGTPASQAAGSPSPPKAKRSKTS